MRKNATKLAAAVLSLAMVMTSVNMPASAAKTKVKLNKTKATLYVNGSASEKATTLKVTVNGKKVNATFKSSNTKVLTVAKKTGKVTAKKNGTAKVTATYKKKKYNCTVTVKTYATSVSITSAKTLNLAAGKTATINATVKPSTASNKKVSFASSDKNVATVTSAGKVTAKKAGTATVTVKALGSKKAAKKATVKVNVKAAVKPSTEPTTTPTTEPTATPETPVATEGAITVTTNVTGAAVKIMDGATPVATGSTMSAYTYTTEKIKYGSYVVIVSKEGYKDATQTVVLDKALVNVDVKLESVNEVKAELKDAYKVNDTKVQVNFTNKIAVPTAANFAIDGLKITDVKLTDDQKSVVLTVEGMELDKTYTVKTTGIVDANNKPVTDGKVDFVARKIAYKAKMEIVNTKTGESITEIKSDGKETAKFVVTLMDDAGNVIKDDAEIRFTTTAGNFAETKVSAQSGVATNIFTSEISATKKDALVTATVVSSKNKDLINVESKRTLSMSPVIGTNNGASLTDVMVETCDRVILYFNKDVNVTDFTKNTSTEKYAYDPSKLEITIGDNAGTEETVDKVTRKITPIALAPVSGETKALYAILDTDTKNDSLTDNSKAIVQIKDKTKSVPTTESKSTYVTDVRNPSMLSVTNDGLRKIKVTFSEPVQNAFGSTDTKATELGRWVINNIKLDDARYGVTFGQGTPATAEVGKFDKNTGVDNRNVVTITLGKDKDGNQIYFKAGNNSVQGNNIGDWANVTDAYNNRINTQTLDFVIEADDKAPTATVTVESPEQYDVKFSTPVSIKDLKENLKLQQYKDGNWNDVSENPISVRAVTGSEDEYIVELTKDWTKILDTKNTKKNYYNYNFRLDIKEKTITNASNGLKNAEIKLDLNDAIMTNPDVKSATLTDVKQDGNTVKITMSEPVQINPTGANRTLTPKEEQGDNLSLPIVQFISNGDKETVQGTITAISDHDNTITVVPDSTISTGTWKVVVRNISDDVGNTSETLVEPNFVVDRPIKSDSFDALWIVAVQKGHTDPIEGGTAARDTIYVKFNKQIKVFGGTENAGATTNYTVNGNTLSTNTKIDSSVNQYNEAAVTKNGYSDIVKIQLDNALTEKSNTINISESLKSATGDQLSNGGRKLLTLVDKKSDGICDTDEYFEWNWSKFDKNVIAKDSKDPSKLKVSELQNYFNDGQYKEFDLSNVTIADEANVKKDFILKHTTPVDFNGQTVNELTINTNETGKLEISNVTAAKITINAPNADVILKNVTATDVDVKDVLDGSLVLDGTTKITNLNVTDANAGAIEVKGDAVNITKMTIETTGAITLKVDSTFTRTLPEILVKKACTLNVNNAGENNVTFKIDEAVKLDDMKIKEIVAATTTTSKVIVNTYDAKKKTYVTSADTTKEKFYSQDVQGAVVESKNVVEAKDAVSDEAAKAATKAKADVSLTGTPNIGKITIKVVEGTKVTAASVDVKNSDALDAVVANLAKANLSGYTLKYENSELTIEAATAGAAHNFDVIMDYGTTNINGITSYTKGEDAVVKCDAVAAVSDITVKQGSEIAGTMKITINSKEISVNVEAGDSANTIAKNIKTAIVALEDAFKSVELTGSTVRLTSKTAGTAGKITIDTVTFIAN